MSRDEPRDRPGIPKKPNSAVELESIKGVGDAMAQYFGLPSSFLRYFSEWIKFLNEQQVSRFMWRGLQDMPTIFE